MKGGSHSRGVLYGIATVEAKRSRPIDAGRPLGQHTLNDILPRVCHPVWLHSLGSLHRCILGFWVTLFFSEGSPWNTKLVSLIPTLDLVPEAAVQGLVHGQRPPSGAVVSWNVGGTLLAWGQSRF